MAEKKTTTTVTDKYGNEVEVPLGADGKNPVSPNNPPAKALAEDPEEIKLQDGPKQAVEANREPVGDEFTMTEEAAKKAKKPAESKASDKK